MWEGGEMCGMVVHCVVGRCTVWQGGALYGRAV